MILTNTPDAPKNINGPNLEAFNCNFTDYSTRHEFRVLAQTVLICNVDLREESFRVRTEIQVFPMRSDCREIHLHLGEYAYLPNEEKGPKKGLITIDGITTTYRREPIRLDLSDNVDEKNLSHLKGVMNKALGKYRGSLVIDIPMECDESVRQRHVLSIQIDAVVVKPKHGIRFVQKWDKSGNLVPGAHIFTYRSSLLSSTREWVPCFDEPDQLCLWRIEIQTPTQFTAICSGDLMTATPVETRRHKSHVFHVTVPTAASNIGFAIGDFECLPQPDLPDVTSYVPPGLMPLLKHTVQPLPRIFSFLEETLSTRFPYASYKQVFMDNVPEEVISYAGLSMFNVTHLYHKKILDVVQSTRQFIALGVSSQFFGCFVNPATFPDHWLVRSLSSFITGLFIEKAFGSSEYIYQMNRLLEVVCDYEHAFGPVVLSPQNPAVAHAHLHFDPQRPETCSPNYADVLMRKGQLVLRILQQRLGKEPFFKVLHRILMVAAQHSQTADRPHDWYHMIISVDSFIRTIGSVTARELSSFLDLFIHNGGHAGFDVNFFTNRKRNTIELEIRQEPDLSKGRRSYVGPLSIVVQELDGFFTHTVQIDADVSRHDLQCHSKGRRLKKKKVPISTGEELELDLSTLDPDSALLWIRVDPQMHLIRRVSIHQPANQWEYMLRYERDVIAQFDAIENLLDHPIQQTQNVLNEAVQNEKFFYRVRSRAAHCLTEICNKLPEGLMAGKAPVIALFEKLYGSRSAPQIPALHNFLATSSNLQLYFLMTSLPSAIGRIRNKAQHCPADVVRFLLGLIRYNDNSVNRYSDDHYRAALIHGLTTTITAAEQSHHMHQHHHHHRSAEMRPDSLSPEMDEVIFEVTRALNKDQMDPSYRRVVAAAALKAISVLQRQHYIPLDTEVFWAFARSESVFTQLRLSAFICLISLTCRTHNAALSETVIQLFDTLITDPNPEIRFELGTRLTLKAPFVYSNDVVNSMAYPANSSRLAAKLWSLITDMSLEPRIRQMLVDIFNVMYSIHTPLMFRSPEERREMEAEQRQRLEMRGGEQRL